MKYLAAILAICVTCLPCQAADAPQAVTGNGYTITPPPNWDNSPATGNTELEFTNKTSTATILTITDNTRLDPMEMMERVKKKIKSQIPDADFSIPKYATIDKRRWLHITATGIKDGITFSSYTYSGSDGTHEITGVYYTKETTTEEPLLEDAVHSFKFQGIPTFADPSAPSQGSGYLITRPDGWNIQPSNPGQDMTFITTAHVAVIIIIVEEGPVDEQTLISSLTDKMRGLDPNIKFSTPSNLQIDGRTWIKFSGESLSNNTLYAYAYSGPEGTFKITGAFPTDQTNKYANIVEQSALSFKFLARTRATTTQGNGFTFTTPAYWHSIAAIKDEWLGITNNKAWIAITDEPGKNVPLQVMRSLMMKLAKDTAPDEIFSDADSLTIDNRIWNHFTGSCMGDGGHQSFEYYIYSGPEGSFQIYGCYRTKEVDQYAPIFASVAQSLKFPSPTEDTTPHGSSPAAVATLQADQVFQEAISEDSTLSVEARINSVNKLFQKYNDRDIQSFLFLIVGKLYVDLGDADTALAIANNQIKIDQYNYKAWKQKGEILKSANRLPEAFDCFKQSIKLAKGKMDAELIKNKTEAQNDPKEKSDPIGYASGYTEVTNTTTAIDIGIMYANMAETEKSNQWFNLVEHWVDGADKIGYTTDHLKADRSEAKKLIAENAPTTNHVPSTTISPSPVVKSP